MKIGIVGSKGIVGSCHVYAFERLGHIVLEHDLQIPNSTLNNVLESEIIYICVPTPSNADGSCNTSIVEKVIDELHELKYRGIIAIKSTVEPGTTEKLIKRYNPHGYADEYSENYKDNFYIAFCPEFIRERSAFADITENNTLLAVGSSNQHTIKKIIESHGKYPKNVKVMNPTEAEILKYYNNIFNALRVVFSTQFYQICKALGANYDAIKEAFLKRGTATDMYMDANENFLSYGGMCLPKDNLAIAALVKKLGLDLKLFETLEQENNKFKKTVFQGMRLE